MAIDLQNRENIATGWAPPVQFHAPEIGGLVGHILQNRLAQQALTEKNIADAIKQYQGQRSDAAYIDALQKTGLLPEGDYGGLGIKGGESLADMIQRQKAEQALEAHRTAMEARIGGGGGSAGGTSEPETRWDAQGREWRPGPAGRWILITPRGGTGSDPDVAKAVKEQLGLTEIKTEHEKNIAKEKAANEAALKPNVPYSHSDEYNLTVNRLKQLQAKPGMPSTQLEATPQPAPAETGDALPTTQAQPQGTPRPSSYASPDQIRMARARQAMDDPQATPEEKEQARKILAGE